MADARTKLTLDDYLLLPEDGLRHQIIDGEHFVNAAPSTRHQRVVAGLYRQLWACVDDAGIGEVLIAPVDVVLSRHDVVQPDLVVVLNAHAHVVGEARLSGAPDLAVEVLSASTAHLDLDRKLRLYARSGVAEYWIADPGRQQVLVHVVEAGACRLVATEHAHVESLTIAGVAVDLAKVWPA